jgi:hypothetical protein
VEAAIIAIRTSTGVFGSILNFSRRRRTEPPPQGF